MGMETDGSFQIVNSQIPQAELYNYANTIRSLTGGRGLHSEEFSHYENMPKDLEQRVINQYKKSREED
jgi:elongation factor G